MSKKLYMVETINLFRMRYVVNAREASHAEDEVVMNVSGDYKPEFEEFSQKHIDETITSVREISVDEYLKLFDIDNDYLKDWTFEQKMRYINEIRYEENNNE